jgi:cytochrome c2
MDSLELNKIAAAVLTAGLVAMMSGAAARILMHPHELEKNAYQVAVAETGETQAKAKPAPEQSILALLPTASAEKGESIAKKCAACHTFEKGGGAKVGPPLWGVVGRHPASVEGFSYSDALKSLHDKTWTYENINNFIHDPRAYAPGTKMTFAGLSKASQRADVIAYLRTLSDSPEPLPQPPAEPEKGAAAETGEAAAPGESAEQQPASEQAAGEGQATTEAPAEGTEAAQPKATTETPSESAGTGTGPAASAEPEAGPTTSESGEAETGQAEGQPAAEAPASTQETTAESTEAAGAGAGEAPAGTEQGAAESAGEAAQQPSTMQTAEPAEAPAPATTEGVGEAAGGSEQTAESAPAATEQAAPATEQAAPTEEQAAPTEEQAAQTEEQGAQSEEAAGTTETGGQAAAGAAAFGPFATQVASADPAAGEKVARKCKVCHTFDKGGKNKIGPNLWDVVGRTPASMPDFKYSDALKALTDKPWTYQNLSDYLTDPKTYAPGNRMAFPGVKKDQDRANLIAYLRTLSDNPAPLPQ